MTSPYKKMKSANKEWISYTQIRQLKKNKPYKIENINATTHPKYGDGQCATLKHPLGNRLRVQLPKKYLANFSKEDLHTIKSDVVNGKIIFLVFREIMNDNSYRIDLTEASEEWIENYNKNEEVKELEDSINEQSENNHDEPNGQSDQVSNKTNADLIKEDKSTETNSDLSEENKSKQTNSDLSKDDK